MWKTYIADKFIWVLAGVFLTMSVLMMINSNWWGLFIFSSGIGAIWFTTTVDKEKGYVEAIYQHKLKRRQEESDTQ